MCVVCMCVCVRGGGGGGLSRCVFSVVGGDGCAGFST